MAFFNVVTALLLYLGYSKPMHIKCAYANLHCEVLLSKINCYAILNNQCSLQTQLILSSQVLPWPFNADLEVVKMAVERSTGLAGMI